MPIRKTPEHYEQAALFGWILWHGVKLHPELDLLYAIPNGGYRGKAEAGKLKAEGVKAGMPDIHLPVARGNFIGLFIEMKSKTGRAEKHQKKMHEKLRARCHRVEVCHGFEAAKAVMLEYLTAN